MKKTDQQQTPGESQKAKENQAVQYKGVSLCPTLDRVKIDTKKELAKIAKVKKQDFKIIGPFDTWTI